MLLKNNSFSIFLPPFYQLLAESFHFFPFSLLPSGTSGLLAFGSLARVRYGPASTFVAMLFHRYASPPIQSRSDLSYQSASLSVAFCNFFCTIPFQYLTFLLAATFPIFSCVLLEIWSLCFGQSSGQGRVLFVSLFRSLPRFCLKCHRFASSLRVNPCTSSFHYLAHLLRFSEVQSICFVTLASKPYTSVAGYARHLIHLCLPVSIHILPSSTFMFARTCIFTFSSQPAILSTASIMPHQHPGALSTFS